MKRVILSVTNDLVTDLRLDKTATLLTNEGYSVLTVGRCYRHSPPLSPRTYQTKRLHLLFKKGFLFYAEYNLRLFFFLLFQKVDILTANDLDTLLPNFLVSKIRRKKILYDSHEYFCGLPELTGRPFVRSVWQSIEKFCFPRLPVVTTVSQSIATLYDKLYPNRKMKVQVIRNVPTKKDLAITETRTSLNLPVDKKIVIMQGSINVDRGAEELIQAMLHVENAVLLIIGDGDVIPELKQLVRSLKLEEKVIFIPRLTPDKLFNYTVLSDIGCSLEKDSNLNYRYCLPNKLFDYLLAQLPVIISDLPEMRNIVETYEVGLILEEYSPVAIANAITKLIEDEELYLFYKNNTAKMTTLFNWEKESQLLRQLYADL
ncbi:MAG TPA: glycosyltransferase family 4 protein [Bacteroidales bacterium]|jgi:glycosyltransferase involved in cell wall biosynthesis|nr:glycosyltransferase family 4 protein [Bacteroidales bacterium]